MSGQTYIAVDLGAGSGRVMLGRVDAGRMSLREISRFPNDPYDLAGSLRWDFDQLFANVKAGIRAALDAADGRVDGIGVDTWGVDYGLLDTRGEMLGPPFNYRDCRTDSMMDAAFERVPKEELFGQTGIQFMQINTIYQLLSAVLDKTQAIDDAETLLFMPDLVNYGLTGLKANERTIASTSQCYNPATKTWAADLLGKLGIPTRLFAELTDPGTVLAPLQEDVAAELETAPIPVIAVGSHDTASAVAAVPAAVDNFAYLSSGTWSLMGIESAAPLIDAKSLALNFTNEVGICDTVRFLKNINGLWILQEARRHWAGEGSDLTFDDMTRLATEAPPFTAVVDSDAAALMSPGDMPARIRELARESGQPEPADRGAVVRTALESLALKYRWVLEKLDSFRGAPTEVLHIVGGGTQNRLLNQFASNAVNRPIITGPVEATAAGNVLTQMLATGALASLAEGRALIRDSFETETFTPQNTEAWDAAYERFLEVLVA